MIFGQKPSDSPDRILPTDTIFRCPKCQGVECASLFVLRTDVLRDGVVVSLPTGDRLSCQRCAHTFSVGPSGAFQHHPHALPFTGEATPLVAAQAPPRPPDDPGPEQPLPRAKPRL